MPGAGGIKRVRPSLWIEAAILLYGKHHGIWEAPRHTVIGPHRIQWCEPDAFWRMALAVLGDAWHQRGKRKTGPERGWGLRRFHSEEERPATADGNCWVSKSDLSDEPNSKALGKMGRQ